MTFAGWLQAAAFFAVVLALTAPVGAFLYRVFEGDRQPLPRVLGRVERGLLRLCGAGGREEQTWWEYTAALLLFSLFGLVVTYVIQRQQHLLPFNPQKLGPVARALAFNTAASFITNTNWQSYAGESTMSHLTQMAGLAWHNFTSAASGLGVALALARGLTRRRGPDAPRTLGNFWVDLIRSILYVLLPLSLILTLVFVASGMVQTLSPDRELTTLEGAKQLLALGPVASQEAIKELGTNGGGFFNANSAHPFENPTPLTNFIELVLIFLLPAGLTSAYGRMAGSARQGWAIFAAMSALFVAGVAVAYPAESRGNPAVAAPGIDQSAGNLEGKEARFGVAASSLFAVVTTDTSCGAVNAMHDSFTPLGGLVPLVNLKLGEVAFGGVGAGLYGMLVFVLLTVFIAGLMVGRTPEYLGKKIESREMKLAMIYLLLFPLLILGFSSWASVRPQALSQLGNAGPHGLSEILYAFASTAANNGSAFAGLDANTPFWNLTLTASMLLGRFAMIVPVMAIAGSMAGKKAVPPSLGTFPTDGWLFSALLVSVVVIVSALTFFPALTLGPLVEHFLGRAGKAF